MPYGGKAGCGAPIVTSFEQRELLPPVRPLLSWLAFWPWVPLWVVFVTIGWVQSQGGIPIGLILTATPESSREYPEVLMSLVVRFVPAASAPQPGDRLVSFGSDDLRGLDPARMLVREKRALQGFADHYEMRLTYARDGVLHDSTAILDRQLSARWFVVIAIFEGLLALLVRLRAPHLPAARSFSVATLLHAIMLPGFILDSDSAMTFCIFARLVAETLLGPAILRCVLQVPAETAPKRTWPYVAIWASALPQYWAWRYWIGARPSLISSEAGWLLHNGSIAVLCAVGLGLQVHNYYRASAVGRRQLRWAIFGLLVAVPVMAGVLAVFALAPEHISTVSPLILLNLAVPVAVAIAIVRHNLFDIDRIISVTVAYLATLTLLLALGFVAVRRVGEAILAHLDARVLSPDLLGIAALAVIAVPAQRFVQPVIERMFFKERFALQQEMAALLSQLGECASLTDLVQLLGRRLDEILRPLTCTVYCRAADGYQAGFVRGELPPLNVELSDPLVAVLARLPGPLARERWTDRRGHPRLNHFDTAALDTLRAAVVVPARRGELQAFVCLGGKRSGDVYTATDLALLAAVADKLASEIHRLVTAVPRQPVMDSGADAPAIKDPVAANGRSAEPQYESLFLKEGVYWTVAYIGSVVRLKDSKGMRYLAWLLRHPAHDFLPLDLVGVGGDGDGEGAVQVRTSGLEILDAQAKAEYRQRLADLREELEEATNCNDLGRSERLMAEMEYLQSELSAAVGLGGEGRKTIGAAERARSTVTKRIKDAIKKIDEVHPPLGQHLRACVKTGSVCGYYPPRDRLPDWKF